jgi:hypothetical protein
MMQENLRVLGVLYCVGRFPNTSPNRANVQFNSD